MEVRVQQATAPSSSALNIVNPQVAYSTPYLIDFEFGLKDQRGNAIVAEPAQFRITAREGPSPVPSETTVLFARAATRLLRLVLVLDYSLGMQRIPNAVPEMERILTDTLLPVLNDDAQVALVEFHRDDLAPALVENFSIDHARISDRIRAIPTEYVQNFYSGSRLFDAVESSAALFGNPPRVTEDRYLLVCSNGIDTSRLSNADAAVKAATERNVRIYTVFFGSDTRGLPVLLDLSTRTRGQFFIATDATRIRSAFEHVIADLEGQYHLRWATLKRGDTSFFPAFEISINNTTQKYRAPKAFAPNTYAGNVLAGRLRLVRPENALSAVVFLRAEYVPRNVNRFRFHVKPAYPASVRLVDPGQNGILGGWQLETAPDPETEGTWITTYSTDNVPLPFAVFGPMLRFDFEGAPTDGSQLFNEFTPDNSIYTQGQNLCNIPACCVACLTRCAACRPLVFLQKSFIFLRVHCAYTRARRAL